MRKLIKILCYAFQELRILSITNNDWSDWCSAMAHQIGSYACQWLDNVDMHTYAKFDQNIPYGSSVMSIFTYFKRTDERTDGLTQRVHLQLVRRNSFRKTIGVSYSLDSDQTAYTNTHQWKVMFYKEHLASLREVLFFVIIMDCPICKYGRQRVVQFTCHQVVLGYLLRG